MSRCEKCNGLCSYCYPEQSEMKQQTITREELDYLAKKIAVCNEDFKKKSYIEWHKYPDEKPPESEDVLCWDGSMAIRRGFSEKIGFYDIWDDNSEDQLITHWAYMPEGPQ